jgi:hypothetical protein
MDKSTNSNLVIGNKQEAECSSKMRSKCKDEKLEPQLEQHYHGKRIHFHAERDSFNCFT